MAGPRRGKREKSDAKGARILIVEARYYDDIADLLLAGAMKVLEGGAAPRSSASRCPARSKSPPRSSSRSTRRKAETAGLMTASWRLAASSAATPSISRSSRICPRKGLMDLSVARALPIGNGIVTVNTVAQALARARIEEQDKGGDAAPRRARAGPPQASARGEVKWRVAAKPERLNRARPTSAARRGSPPCRRFTRWTSPAPA